LYQINQLTRRALELEIGIARTYPSVDRLKAGKNDLTSAHEAGSQ
jgi:hypothetical protein